MIFLKFICAAIAIIATCLYISNIVFDITSSLTWRTSLSLDEDPVYSKEIGENYSNIRIILAIVMGLAWAGVIVL